MDNPSNQPPTGRQLVDPDDQKARAALQRALVRMLVNLAREHEGWALELLAAAHELSRRLP
jgi:hypothetical protein